MKCLLITVVTLFFINPAYAFDLDDKMYLTEHYISYTTSYDISTDEKKLGTMYRRILSLNTKYDYYDCNNHLLATAESHFFSYGAHLDLFDQNRVSLGSVEEKLFTWFPCFEIYSPDGSLMASAIMNFWGTTFTVHDGRSDHELATMSRNFFRVSNNWTLEIQDKATIRSRQIDPRLLLTVLVMQSDIEYLQKKISQINNHQSHQGISVPQSLAAHVNQARHELISMNNGSAKVRLPTEHQLESLAKQLAKDFQLQYADITMSPEDKNRIFVDYCTNIAKSVETRPQTRIAIVYLLNKRLRECLEHWDEN